MLIILTTLLLFINSDQLYARLKTICGDTDDRVLWDDPSIARLHDQSLKAGCTATLFSDRCLISAAHCEKYLRVAEFNVPPSNEDGSINHSQSKDIYRVDKNSIVTGRGIDDWAVMSVFKNSETGLYPGEIAHPYKIAYEAFENQSVYIGGYGSSRIKELNNVLKIAHGSLSKIDGFRLYYQVDTTSGDSGSAIINQSGQIIGIHTLGGCNSDFNKGILIGANPKLIDAIKKCLSK